ncbi:MAG TPA: DMT family transporter [Candidatus Binatia bacterium]|nr:DMT family transporter [Candidatus Binatia bacterium]
MTRRGLVLFAAMSVIWGIPYLLIRIAVSEISPATLVLARTGIATAILLPIAIARVDFGALRPHWPWIVAFALVEIAAPWVLLGSAEQRISSSLAGILVAAVPLVGAAIALLTRGADRLGTTGFAGLLIGIVGVGAIVGADVGAEDAVAVLEMGGVVFGYALGPAILARRLGGVSSLGVMTVSLGLCALLYLPIVALDPPAGLPSPAVLAAVVILAVVCTALAFLVFAALIAEIGPVRATVITYVNPAVAAVLGVLLLGEDFSLSMALGFGLVVAGSALATRGPTASTAEASPLVLEPAGDAEPGSAASP